MYEYFRTWALPVHYTAPASFKANPIEMVFAQVKQNFSEIIESKAERVNHQLAAGDRIPWSKEIPRMI